MQSIATGLTGGVTLGPRRVVPLALAAQESPGVLAALERQVKAPVPRDHDGRFLRPVPGQDAGGLEAREAQLFGRMRAGFQPMAEIVRTRMEGQAIKRLITRGVVQVAGVTPTDALHCLGDLAHWNAEAARFGLALMARRRTGAGTVLAETPEALAQMIVDQLTRQTTLVLLEAGFAEEGWDGSVEDLARHPILQAALGGHRAILELKAGLALPVVGLGASARRYYPAVGEALGARILLPELGGVANAIGAVVGQITVRREGTVTAPSEGCFRVHLDEGPQDFGLETEALEALVQRLENEARDGALAAEAEGISVRVTRDVRRVQIEAREVFVEARVIAEASGRPRIAR